MAVRGAGQEAAARFEDLVGIGLGVETLYPLLELVDLGLDCGDEPYLGLDVGGQFGEVHIGIGIQRHGFPSGGAKLVGQGLTVLAEALTLVARTGERLYEAEIFRLTGALLLDTGAASAAETSLQQALHIARQQQARALELRTAVSLGRLWQRQGSTSPSSCPLRSMCISSMPTREDGHRDAQYYI